MIRIRCFTVVVTALTAALAILAAVALAVPVSARDHVPATGTIVIVGPHPHRCVNVKLWFGTYDRRHRIRWLQGTAIVCFNRHEVTIKEPPGIGNSSGRLSTVSVTAQ